MWQINLSTSDLTCIKCIDLYVEKALFCKKKKKENIQRDNVVFYSFDTFVKSMSLYRMSEIDVVSYF